MCGRCAARWEPVVLDGSWRTSRRYAPRARITRVAVSACVQCRRVRSWAGWAGGVQVQFSSVQFSSVQISSVQFSSEHPGRRRPACLRRRSRMHACMHAQARGRLAAQNGARPHASAHCSPQPPPVAAASPTLESPFARLSHVANHAQLLSQLLADQ